MERRLAAILALDMVGYSRLMGSDEGGTITRQKLHRESIIDPQIASYAGRIVKTTGDGLLVEFPSVVDAVDCAQAFQSAIAEQEQDIPEEQRILYRAGINLGDIVIDGDDILGDGVNVAARLEAIARPSGLCVSDMVRQNLRGAVSDSFEDMGDQALKNIERKVRVWQWPATGNKQAGPTRGETVAHTEGSLSTIAVLPFETLSSDPDHHFYAEGFAEGVATAVAKLETLRLVPAAKEEGFESPRYHVKGNIRIAGPRIRCNIHVVDGSNGHRLWAEKFDGEVTDVFDLEDQITDQIVAALEVELTEGQQVRLWHGEAGSSRAYDHFLQGRGAYKEYSRSGNARARAAYETALQLSPNFLSAACGLARVHIEDATFGWSSDKTKSLEEARRLLDGVFAIDPDHASAHMEMSHTLMVEGDFSAARLEGELAVALDPNSADAHQALAHVLVCLQLPEDALRSARRAIALNPETPGFYLIVMAEAFIALKQYQEALAVTEKIIAERPAWIMARISKALALEGLGKQGEAKAEIQDLLQISPRFTAGRWRQIIFYPDRPDVPELIDRLASIGLPPQ